MFSSSFFVQYVLIFFFLKSPQDSSAFKKVKIEHKIVLKMEINSIYLSKIKEWFKKRKVVLLHIPIKYFWGKKLVHWKKINFIECIRVLRSLFFMIFLPTS